MVKLGMTAVRPDWSMGIGLRASSRSPGQETTEAIIIIDADGNGVPDELEKRTESGGCEMESATAKAIISDQPLEQPCGAGEETPDFTMGIERGGDVASPKTGTLSGRCEPGSVCLVYVYSYVPLVLTVTADDSGSFTYDLSDEVADGSHTVYVAVTDESGKITRKSRPFSLLVSEARAVTAEDLLALDPVSAAQAEVSEDKEQRSFVLASVVLMLVTAAFFAFVLRRKIRLS
jgi:hypothetical protein